MKKIIILCGLVGMVFATRYPMILEYNYLKGCINSNKNIKNMEKYCVCTLDAIEKKYTLNQFMEILQNPKTTKKVINYAVNQCLDKLKK